MMPLQNAYRDAIPGVMECLGSQNSNVRLTFIELGARYVDGVFM